MARSTRNLVDQPTMMPTRKTASGGMQGVSVVVGLNLLADVVLTRMYGGLDMVPENEMKLALWLVSAIPVAWQFCASYVTREEEKP